MQTRLQTPTTTRKMRKRALRTRNEIFFRVLTDKRTLIDLLAPLGILPFQTTIYEAQHPEHWRGCTIIGFLRSFSREAMWALRKSRVVVLPIGHRSRYVHPLAGSVGSQGGSGGSFNSGTGGQADDGRVIVLTYKTKQDPKAADAIGHRSRFIAPDGRIIEQADRFMVMEPGKAGNILTVDTDGTPCWRPS